MREDYKRRINSNYQGQNNHGSSLIEPVKEEQLLEDDDEDNLSATAIMSKILNLENKLFNKKPEDLHKDKNLNYISPIKFDVCNKDVLDLDSLSNRDQKLSDCGPPRFNMGFTPSEQGMPKSVALF